MLFFRLFNRLSSFIMILLERLGVRVPVIALLLGSLYDSPFTSTGDAMTLTGDMLFLVLTGLLRVL